MSDSSQAKRSLDPKGLTWAALLGQWVAFARSALALPNDESGRAMRDSVTDIITLQAVWFSLRDIETLPHDERMLGLDRAEVLIDKHEKAIMNRWGVQLPAKLSELIDDVRQQLAVAQSNSS